MAQTPYQKFIFYQFYARWRDEYQRRETWDEAVTRYMDYMKLKMSDKLTNKEYQDIEAAILCQDICPSMRLLWSAGDAVEGTNVTAYNCAYIVPTSWQDISEIMYVSMCGAGCGFAAEQQNVNKFPRIKKQTGATRPTIVVDDSREGWCNAFQSAATIWTNGDDVELDYSQVRPAGAKLKTMGGRASGPQPLIELMEYTRAKILSRQGKQLSTLDIHDIICQVGQIVVAGGVRRSALISLSDLSDTAIRDAKKGKFWEDNPQRAMANNSAVYESKPEIGEFLKEWTALVNSGSGERGIFNRGEILNQVPARRAKKLNGTPQIGVNPCGVIYLRSKQFCNLSSIVVRPDDDMPNLLRKIRLATIVGTYQATLTKFGYLSDEWRRNCEEEQLLGVSITGYYDNIVVRNDANLEALRTEAVHTNKQYAHRFGSNPSTAITCVKPHGNSGQLLGVGSGMHPWFSKYFIRRVRISAHDPLYKFAIDQGVPIHPEVGSTREEATTFVLEFPVKAPVGAITSSEVSAIEMLREWKRLKTHFTEHNPSVTIYADNDEWLEVANYVYKNWSDVGGLSFLPRTDHVYELAPYEAITEDQYKQRVFALGEIDFTKLKHYESNDQTTGAKELACSAGICEL